MSIEIIHEYVTCELGGTGSAKPVSTDAGKDYAVTLSQTNSDSIHPTVEYAAANDPIYGKFISITPNGNLARVAVRGDHMIFAGNSTATTEVADADVGKGVLGADDTALGRVKAGGAIGSRDADEKGNIIGGTLSKIRVSFP